MTRVLAFAERDARIALSMPASLVMPFASIVITVAGFAFLARLINPHAPLESDGRHVDYFTYVVLNLGFMLICNQALLAASSGIRRDQVAGTLESIVATSTPLVQMLAGSSLWPMLFAALEVVAYILTGMAFGMRLGHVDVMSLVTILVLSIACMGTLGVIGAALVVRYRQAPPSSLLTGSAAALVTGVLFPVQLLPVPLRVVSWLLPLTHALHGIRAAMLGASLFAVRGNVLWLLIATAVLAPVAFVAFSQALRRARIDGTLGSF